MVRDRFRARLTFPVQDLQGRYLGFGARVLPSDARAAEQAKYLNTAETPIYKKGEILYNLQKARQAVARSGQVFVVEGYTDVIGLAQAGIDNAVATCGTALGEGHFRLLSRFAQQAVLAFDSDEAGARAAERAFGFQEQYPVQAVVMIMPEGLDPAEFVAKHGPDEVREAAKSARPLVEYMVRRTVERHDLLERRGTVGGGRERPADPPGADGSGPSERVRASAGGPDGGLGGLRADGAGSAARAVTPSRSRRR